uniref:Uncharacterized protein n=1 Tax=Rhizophora mucronata TaxID=61149 RepID=A0A2P2NKM6_RHIMU
MYIAFSYESLAYVASDNLGSRMVYLFDYNLFLSSCSEGIFALICLFYRSCVPGVFHFSLKCIMSGPIDVKRSYSQCLTFGSLERNYAISCNGSDFHSLKCLHIRWL